MEVLVHIIHYLLRTLNRVGMKPLPRVVPDANLLRKHPMYVGPRKKYGTVLGITLVASAILWIASCAGFVVSLDLNPQGLGRLRAGLLVTFWILWLGGPVLIGYFAKRYIAARTERSTLLGTRIRFL